MTPPPSPLPSPTHTLPLCWENVWTGDLGSSLPLGSSCRRPEFLQTRPEMKLAARTSRDAFQNICLQLTFIDSGTKLGQVLFYALQVLEWSRISVTEWGDLCALILSAPICVQTFVTRGTLCACHSFAGDSAHLVWRYSYKPICLDVLQCTADKWGPWFPCVICRAA